MLVIILFSITIDVFLHKLYIGCGDYCSLRYQVYLYYLLIFVQQEYKQSLENVKLFPFIANTPSLISSIAQTVTDTLMDWWLGEWYKWKTYANCIHIITLIFDTKDSWLRQYYCLLYLMIFLFVNFKVDKPVMPYCFVNSFWVLFTDIA